MSGLKRVLIAVAAVIFLALGIIGLALPFLQGILFIVIGLILLSLVSPLFQQWLEKHTRRFPRLHALIVKTENWVRKIIGENTPAA